MYIQPIEHNRAAHVEFNFFHDPEDEAEKAVIGASTAKRHRLLWLKVLSSQDLTVIWPLWFMTGAAGYTMALRRTKKVFDPKNVMNPGQSLFLGRDSEMGK